MGSEVGDQRGDRLREVVAHIRDRIHGPEADSLERFARVYYRRLAPEEFAGRPVEALYGAVLSLWKFAQHRPPGSPVIRLYNPRVEEHGWKSP
ncbi:MAG: hypothetical protein HQ511_02660, partial [Rhodospirillales bacterium]|nr:hypothetical protein [Rhodospirillales bacterium]